MNKKFVLYKDTETKYTFILLVNLSTSWDNKKLLLGLVKKIHNARLDDIRKHLCASGDFQSLLTRVISVNSVTLKNNSYDLYHTACS